MCLLIFFGQESEYFGFGGSIPTIIACCTAVPRSEKGQRASCTCMCVRVLHSSLQRKAAGRAVCRAMRWSSQKVDCRCSVLHFACVLRYRGERGVEILCKLDERGNLMAGRLPFVADLAGAC